jgi:hypothetical protein
LSNTPSLSTAVRSAVISLSNLSGLLVKANQTVVLSHHRPSGVAPPLTTQTCPENTALDASGNCAPVTQGQTDQGTTTQSPSSDDNKPLTSKR